MPLQIPAFREAVHNELTNPLIPTPIDELKWYLDQCRHAAIHRPWLPSDARFRRLNVDFEVNQDLKQRGGRILSAIRDAPAARVPQGGGLNKNHPSSARERVGVGGTSTPNLI